MKLNNFICLLILIDGVLSKAYSLLSTPILHFWLKYINDTKSHVKTNAVMFY